jgi:hypothetical protein
MAKITIEEIVDLWYETQYGHYLKCREKQVEFSDLMWKLHKDFYPEDN